MHGKMIAVILAVGLALSACGPKANAPDDVAALKAMEQAYLQAVNAGDAAAVSALYAENAVRMGPNMPAILGREAVKASYQQDFELFRSEETNTVEDAQVVGDLAFVRGTYANKMTAKIPGPASIEDKGKWAAVSRRQSDGSWLYLFDTWSSDLPAGRTLYPGGAEERTVLELEMSWAAAMMRRDADSLEPILADTFAENAMGVITKKKEYLAGLKKGSGEGRTVETGDMRVLVFGEFAVVNGRGSVKETVGGKEVVNTVRYIDTFQKQDAGWKAVSAYLVPDK